MVRAALLAFLFLVIIFVAAFLGGCTPASASQAAKAEPDYDSRRLTLIVMVDQFSTKKHWKVGYFKFTDAPTEHYDEAWVDFKTDKSEDHWRFRWIGNADEGEWGAE